MKIEVTSRTADRRSRRQKGKWGEKVENAYQNGGDFQGLIVQTLHNFRIRLGVISREIDSSTMIPRSNLDQTFLFKLDNVKMKVGSKT